MEVKSSNLDNKLRNETLASYDSQVAKCREIFQRKTEDYGSAWRILRSTSLTDQLFIKAQRIRTIQEKKTQLIVEGIEPEFIGLVNYSVMALIQLEIGSSDDTQIEAEEVERLFKKHVEIARQLMLKKNHDYGEAWRDMRVSSITDLILMKILRIKQIEDNNGNTVISEGVDANYLDIINYALFALIKLSKEA